MGQGRALAIPGGPVIGGHRNEDVAPGRNVRPIGSLERLVGKFGNRDVDGTDQHRLRLMFEFDRHGEGHRAMGQPGPYQHLRRAQR